MTKTPQVTFFLDPSGQVRCEVPGINGFRKKVELPPDFAARNLEVMRLLHEQEWHLDVWRRQQVADAREAKREAARSAAAHERALEKARSIWTHTSEVHSIELANRVIPDKKRRPARKVVVYDAHGDRREYAPRSGTTNKRAETSAQLEEFM
jgi:hypothetical protein